MRCDVSRATVKKGQIGLNVAFPAQSEGTLVASDV